MNLKNWVNRGFIFGLVILVVGAILFFINAKEIYITPLEFIFAFIPSIILGFLLSLSIEFFLNWKKMKNKIFKISLFVFLLILGIPSILVILLFATTDPNYCSEDFLMVHKEQSKIGDTSICDTFAERGYTDFKGNPICYNKETGKSFTRLDCIVDVAKEVQDIKICDLIGNGETCGGNGCHHWPDQCYEEIQNLTLNPDWCGSLTKNRGSCLGFIAKKTNNVKLCKSISGQTQFSTGCLTNLSIENKDISLCYSYQENFSDDMDVRFCIEDFQRKTNANWTVCLNLENVDMKQICFQELIPFSQDLTLCDKYVRSCIALEACRQGSDELDIGLTEKYKIMAECQNKTIAMINSLPNQAAGTLKKNRESIYSCNGRDYTINLIKVNEFYSIDDLDSVTVTINDEIVRNYALHQEYEMLDGTKFVFISIEGTKENPIVDFVIGCK